MPHTTVIVPPSALPARPLAARLVLAASYASMGAALWVLWLPRWLPPATLPLGLPPTPRDASFGWLVRLAAVAALGYCPGARLVVAKPLLRSPPKFVPLARHAALAAALAGLAFLLGPTPLVDLVAPLLPQGGFLASAASAITAAADAAISFAGPMLGAAFVLGAGVFVVPAHFERSNPYATATGDNGTIPVPSPRRGVLVANLGTPVAPRPAEVATFLRAFLSDTRVIEVAPAVWWFVLNCIIVPIRKYSSAMLYSRIFSEDGKSPLLLYGTEHATALQAALGDKDFDVQLGMRYGEPSIDRAIAHFMAEGVSDIVVMTAYPQYSGTTVASIYDAVYAAALRYRHVPAITVIPPYYDHPAYISAIASRMRETRAALPAEHAPQLTLFSFHGIPASYVHRGDPYPAHCEATAAAVAAELGLAPDAWHLCYQSQFGSDPWLQPYTDELLVELAEAWTGDGPLNILAVCPGFLVDCLETIDEIGEVSAEVFAEAGGGKLTLVPCLNADPTWIDASVAIPFLSDGPGCEHAFDACFDLLTRDMAAAPPPLPPSDELAISWGPAGGLIHHGSALCLRISFSTPASPLLEPGTGAAVVDVVVPWPPTDADAHLAPPPHDAEPSVLADALAAGLAARPIAILCPMTGDIGPELRISKYSAPLAAAGISSAIINAPYYGDRRPPGWTGSYGVPTVEAMMAQATGVIVEALATAQWARSTGASAVCYAGVSWGGAMSSMANLLDHDSSAVVTTAGSHSPAPAFVDGAMARSVPWDAHGGKSEDNLMVVLLRRISTTMVTEFPAKATGAARVIRHISAPHDHYIPRDSSLRLFDSLVNAPGTVESARVEVLGGHASTVLFYTSTHVDAILDALAALKRTTAATASPTAD
ncbi:ferrochelatase [Thecamonas trahens ATCC 50062]|uniref:Ferrochelatase n=1 Tax=Thecamonas trahens ATCC 50062 TaxID=461836 RepID=A0A0L0DG05_THETB|nr:ferrochelatase [Thecamonas trahens ATCC 50062]KNC50273.1 ferrochelatase [Thecamonas trahens ATCC 50062]|eukprot:XP_013757100.1 ferrochelatase [Thecamonas trahens ATCC 50062]